MLVAHLLFRSTHRYQMAQVAFQAKVAPFVVEVHPCLCASSVSEDFLLCNLGMEGSHPFDFHEQLPGVFERSPHFITPRKLNTPLLLLLDFGGRFLD
jgi:hypothetical protein